MTTTTTTQCSRSYQNIWRKETIETDIVELLVGHGTWGMGHGVSDEVRHRDTFPKLKRTKGMGQFRAQDIRADSANEL